MSPDTVRVLFVSNYFPPEVNAPANRLVEHARQWVADGRDIEVLTSVPNFPEGEVYTGYRNALTLEEIDGIPTVRVPVYVAPNVGKLRRILAYLSFMASAVLFAGRVRRRPDVVVATSPQFFAAVGGWLVALRFGAHFVMEVRDLWPESIVAVGAFRKGIVTRALLWLERFMYRRADRIVVVTEAFRRVLVEEKGVPADRVAVIPNGVDLAAQDAPVDPAVRERLAREHDLAGRFVVSYIGTLGMAHRADVLLDAADACDDPDIVFVVMGAGAEREALARRAAEADLDTFRLVDKQPRHVARAMMELTSASVVHLRDDPLFRTVIPSKAFDAMGAGRPVILAVDGEIRRIVEGAGAGVYVPAEDAGAIAAAAKRLKDDPAMAERMGRSGRSLVEAEYDRRVLARRYWALLDDVGRG